MMDNLRVEGKQQIVLGCVQLGLDYGIANKNGKPDFRKALNMISTAIGCGIDTFDTAQAYGDSEEVLGKALKELGAHNRVKVISKLSPSLDVLNSDAIKNTVEESLAKLGIEDLECLMLHRAEWMDFLDKGLAETLCEIRRNGKAKTLGVSVYTPEEAIKALESDIFDTIQAPINAWDTRMIENGVIELAEKNRKEIHIRSIFLQGLLLMTPDDVKSKFPYALEASQKWNSVVERSGMNKKNLAMGFVKSLAFPLVIGAENAQQIKENVLLYSESTIEKDVFNMISREMKTVINNIIINPALWK